MQPDFEGQGEGGYGRVRVWASEGAGQVKDEIVRARVGVSVRVHMGESKRVRVG